MIDIFNEKAYDRLDFLTKAIEPWTYPSLEKLVAAAPDRVEVDLSSLQSYGGYWPSSVSTLELLTGSHKSEELRVAPYQHKQAIESLYETSIEGSGLVDRKTMQMDGKIVVTKVRNLLAVEEIERMVKEAIGDIGSAGAGHYDRIRETAGVLGVDFRSGTRRVRSERLDTFGVLFSCGEKIRSGEWNVRNGDLVETLGKTINRYVNEGGVDGMNWLCRFKLALRTKRALYEIGEMNDGQN